MTNQDQDLPGTPSSRVTEQTVVNRAKVILKQLNEQPAKMSLDAGCGLGVYHSLLSSHSSQVVGIDIIGAHLKQIRANTRVGNIQLACMALEQVGFPNGVFDFIICIETLEHVTNDESVIKEFRRLLKPGGRIIISVPYKWFPFETHGVRVGSRVVASPFGLGFPFLTFLPSRLRKLFATARVYSARELEGMLERNDFLSREVLFLMPGLDIFEKKTKSKFLAQFLQKFFRLLQKSLSKTWGSTIMIIGQAR